ncbi:TPA: hypothetical protein NNP44_004634, partial [Salmonella enterica]|nr:hypothetical protein [Salmonella enterica]
MSLFDTETMVVNKRSKKKPKDIPKVLKHFPIVNRPYVEFTDMELYAARGGTLTFDIETYKNYFLIAFKCVETKRVVTFEKYGDIDFNKEKLNWVLFNFRLISFNGRKFDMPLAWLAVFGKPVWVINEVAQKLITDDKYRVRDVEREYNFKMPTLNHIDLIEVAPLQASLKTYSGRLHAPRMQDLPYDPHKILTVDEMVNVKYYCVNDLDNTELLFKALAGDISLRETLSVEYGQDLRSLSDAQIAEHVLSAECAKINGYHSFAPKIAVGSIYKYYKPDFIHFQTPMMQKVLSDLLEADFVIIENGSPKCAYLDGLKISIGEQVYTMGVGGLHSTESCIAHKAENGYMLIDRDVASYYPYIILNNKFYPKHLGETFLIVYQTIVDRRIYAKHMAKSDDAKIAKDSKQEADSLKITINGSFGKLGSKWSKLYSPDLLIQVTVTGQLCLLMLIEMLELNGIKVVSANTDGIVIMPHESQYDRLNEIVKMWESLTNFETEETRYSAVYSRDVNNYIAIYDKPKKDEYYKGKGVFGDNTLKKQPQNEICAKAAAQFLIDGTPVRKTIEDCTDISQFITAKTVKGGAHKDGWLLGKAIRWYYANDIEGTINYITNGNTVPLSEGAKPCMDLPAEFPT